MKIKPLLIPILSLLTLIGWGWALKLKFASPVSAKPDVRAKSSSQSTRRVTRGSSGSSIAALLPTARSARLVAHIDKIAAAAKPGEVNEALITACRDTLVDSDAFRRSRDFALLLELMRPEDAAAVHENFLKMHSDGLGYGVEYSYFAKRWGEVDGAGALGFLMNEKPLRLPQQDVHNIVYGWAKTDHAAALRWMDDHPDLANSHSGWSTVIAGWIGQDPAAATAYLRTHGVPPEQLFRSLFDGATEQVFNNGVREASRWIASLPEDGINGPAASHAWNSAMREFSELTYENAAEVWLPVSNKSWMRFEQFEHFSDMVSKTRASDRGLEGFLDTLQTKWPAETAAAQFVRWHADDPARVDQWLAKAPNCAFTESLRAELGAEASGGQ